MLARPTKILAIERPAFLATMRRQIQWVYQDLQGKTFDLRDTPRAALQTSCQFAQALHGGPTAVGQYVKATQLLEGALLIVDERVSRELEVSTVAGTLAHLVWPATCFEMRFADPGLPAIIVCSAGVRSGDGEEGIALAADTNEDDSTLTLAVPERLWAEYVEGQFISAMKPKLAFDLALSAAEAEAMRYLTTLAVKVVAYCSVPQHAPVLLTSKAERKAAGLHPKHGRAGERALAVRYLPRVIREPSAGENNPTGKSHQFFGRAGHVRYYEAERYTKMKGQWQWLPPISPPEGVQVIYKVRSV